MWWSSNSPFFEGQQYICSLLKRHDPRMRGSVVCEPFERLFDHLGCVGPSPADTPPTIRLPVRFPDPLVSWGTQPSASHTFLTIFALCSQSKTQLLWEVYTSILWATPPELIVHGFCMYHRSHNQDNILLMTLIICF